MNLEGYKKREFFTITELDTMARCARKYFYSCGCGLRPSQNEIGQSAMYFGTCIHRAIGAYFDSFNVSKAMEVFEKEWTTKVCGMCYGRGWEQAGGPHFANLYQEKCEMCQGSGRVPSYALPDDKRNVDTARMMLFSFSSHHPRGGGLYTPLKPPVTNVEISKDDQISDWEIPFAIDLGISGSDGRSLPLVGRIDGWCRSNNTGEIWLNEFKTTSEMSKRFLEGFKRAPQILGYTLAARTQGWSPIKGVFLEALKVAKTSWDTMIVPVEVPDFELERFVLWAKTQAMKILHYEDIGEWPHEPSGCSTYAMFGQPGYFCDYDALCSVPDWSTMKSFFRVERHVPFVMPTVKGKELVK